ncbi:hypothetical protein [Streptomyces sp. NBC_01443]|uniref:hypothetical protein n=1 Tax=Streptomyces sp. NBC_01443 TaxID=2903868 RepID=UPI00225BF219|nr:hypothetical protein [Streptomyces sp. NBC_01443]MCX4625512.1 hypothetical protein [Streptomyces sp. NBC_01443]
MTAAEPPRLRLRPGVAVTPLRNGLHLRGRDGSVTLEGSKALPALWELLSEQLCHGREDVLGQEGYRGEEVGRPRLDPADPRVEAALHALTEQLHTHDLLTEYPAGAAEPAAWLGASVQRPGLAAAALAAARPVVAAADPEGPLATALISVLSRAGAPPKVYRDTGLPADRVVAVAGTSPVAVAVARTADGGFVTAPAEPERARADAESIAARLRPDTGSAGTGSTPAGAPAGSPAALTSLLAGAAAQRLLCAAAGLPDPAGREEDPQLLADRPAVLVAVARPPHASYRPWVTGPADHASLSPAPVASLAEALRGVGALGDPYLGVLDAPRPGDLPQLPAGLAACSSVAGPLVAGAPRTDLARLSAACRAAELHLGEGMPGPVAVGAGPGHALGRALRRAAIAAASSSCPDRSPSEEEWREHPQARHWWTVLTRHLGLPMEMTVHRFTAEQAYLAVVRNPAGRAGTAGVAARAVEATPADAAALAALGAVTRAMAAVHGPAGAVHTAFSGAEAPLAVAGVEPAAWTDEGWTDRWLAGIARREPELCAVLTRLTGLRPDPWQPGGADLAGSGAAGSAGPVLAALHACGFTVLAGWGGAR